MFFNIVSFNLLSSLMNSFSMIFENIFSWKPHVTFVTGCPCFFLHYFWMADIDMSHPVLSIRKFTWACWTPAKIWKIYQIINFRLFQELCKVNSVQEACAKCFQRHIIISKFQELHLCFSDPFWFQKFWRSTLTFDFFYLIYKKHLLIIFL